MGKKEIVSARLHKSTKEKLIATGYNPAEAIEFFVYLFYNDKEAIERAMIEIKLNNLKKIQEDIKGEIEIVEKQLMEGVCG